MNDFEVRQQILVNRLRKVPKLIAALDVLLERDWDVALQAAVPSETTRQMVIDALRNRIRIRNRFDGTPNVLGLHRQVTS